MTRNTHRHCSNCGTGVNKANMGRNCHGDLVCPTCYTDPDAVPDDAPEMPGLGEIDLS